MRGRKQVNQTLKSGRTIVAERERAESESERMLARKKAHRKHTTSVVIVLLMAVVLALVAYMTGKEMIKKQDVVPSEEVGNETVIRAPVVDEESGGASAQLSVRMREFIATLEEDLRAKGYQVAKVTLPVGKSRERYVDLEGVDSYFKVSVNRNTAVSAEDAERMVRYLAEHDLHPSYVDIRVEGKAYYQ